MPFTSQNYGTFTGPQSILGDYIYDTTALEGTWPTEIPVDTTFKLTDIAAVFFQNPLNYSGFHLYGVVPDFVVLERNTGFIPTFMANIANTIHNGNVIANGVTIQNGATVVNGFASVNGAVNINGILNLTGVPSGGDVASAIIFAIAQPAKPFDIKHPTASKKGWRLRHVSLEGPEIGVYFRGKLNNENKIELPHYWKDLVHQDSITVNLTPIGNYQELFVESISNDDIMIRNREDGEINCHFTVFAERKDMQKLIVEYEGKSIKDYPGEDFLKLREN